jgi:carbon-monoxide dehydrogenase small subunit
MKEMVVKVNGQVRTGGIKDNELLLDLLRDRFEVKSVKAACWRGECGLCTILLNGELVKSCLILAVEADGGDVTTVEGITENGELAPIQKAFVQHGASQCGFCTPAFVLTTHELLKRISNPSDDEVADAVSGLMCRCGTYNQIREAVATASKSYDGQKIPKKLVQKLR